MSIINVDPKVKDTVNKLAHFVRQAGSWTIIVNDLTKTFHVSTNHGMNSVLTAVSGLILYADHKKHQSTPAA